MKKAMMGLLGVMLTATFMPAAATAAEGWQFAVTPYLWGAGIDGTATVGLHEANVDKSFSDILNDLDFAMMVNLQARTGRFGLYTDVTFLGLSDTHEITTPAGAPVLGVETSLDTWIVDFGASWAAARWGEAAQGKGGVFDVFLGGRYWGIDTELKAQSPVFAGERTIGKTMGWIDPLVGARFTTDLTRKLTLLGRADVGGFDLGSASKLTWSASAYLGWHFNQLLSAYAGYKYLSVEREDDKANSVDLAFSGPALGLSFTF
jgi:opacity protein-like surface antigen